MISKRKTNNFTIFSYSVLMQKEEMESLVEMLEEGTCKTFPYLRPKTCLSEEIGWLAILTTEIQVRDFPWWLTLIPQNHVARKCKKSNFTPDLLTNNILPNYAITYDRALSHYTSVSLATGPVRSCLVATGAIGLPCQVIEHRIRHLTACDM